MASRKAGGKGGPRVARGSPPNGGPLGSSLSGQMKVMQATSTSGKSEVKHARYVTPKHKR